jgi:hypothetical protein
MMQDVIKQKVAEAIAAEIPVDRRDPKTEKAILIAVETLCSFIPFDQWQQEGLYDVCRQKPAVKS